MEAKVKEEVPDKDYSQQPTNTERRKQQIPSKEHRSPEQDDSRTSPTPGPPSPTQNNGTADSLSPPLSEGARSAPALQRLRRFLSALQQFATDAGADVGERVRMMIFNLVSGTTTIEEFQSGVQEVTNYPLRASVPGFLRALLPAAQALIGARARHAKQSPLQYIRSHEHLVLEAGGDSSDIFASDVAPKRRASDFYDSQPPQTNGGTGSFDDFPPPPKRAFPTSVFLNPPLLYPMPGGLLDYPHHGYHGNQGDGACERRDGGISVRDVTSMNAPFAETRALGGFPKTDDEWKNINTMLNCILSMVEKTKRALAILQQRGMEPTENNDIKRTASDILASAVRQTEERVAEVRRRAEDAVNQVKRQALVELQRAVGAAEAKTLELVAAERGKMERLLSDRLQETPAREVSPNAAQQNCCWNCGRKAQETCSGCNSARYCGAFCQHKDWEHHHQVCSGRDLKPTTSNTSTTSPPAKPSVRATTPLAGACAPHTTPERDRHGAADSRLSLSNAAGKIAAVATAGTAK